MSGFFGDPAALWRLADTARRMASAVGNTEGDMNGGVSRLVPGSWEGPAADAFRSRWSRQADNLVDLGSAGGRMAAILEHLASDLERANRLADEAEATAGPAGLTVHPDGHVGPAPGVFLIVPTPDAAKARAQAENLIAAGHRLAVSARGAATAALSSVAVPSIGRDVGPARAQDWAHRTSGTSGSATLDWLRANGPELMPDLQQVLVGGAMVQLGFDMTAAAGGLELGGGALDLTGIGAAAGVPVNVLGAGLAVAGAGVAAGGAALAGHGLADIVTFARGRFKGGEAKASENEQARRAARAAGIDTTAGRQALHRAISGQGYSYEEIESIAQELYANYPKYRS
jgi:hypothetical protein